VQHLVRVRAHARALPRGKDDDGKAALIVHGRRNGTAAPSSPDLSLMKRAAPAEPPDMIDPGSA
jgi:hypothetical protein